ALADLKDEEKAPASPLPAPAKHDSALLALVRKPVLSVRLAVMCAAWFSAALGYYGLTIHSNILGGSIYQASLYGGLAEIPPKFALYFMIGHPALGRRLTITMLLLLGGISCILGLALKSTHWDQAAVLAGAVGRGSWGAAFGGVYLYATELFPTRLRSGALGFLSSTARVGSMIAPVVADYAASTSMLAFSVPNILAAGLITLTLPETREVAMPDDAEDMRPTKRPSSGDFEELLLYKTS
ncbi:hypothetical protein CYMTET_15303, partial [Cymbomonas tetramitiformis]